MEHIDLTISKAQLTWLQQDTGETEPSKAVARALKAYKDSRQSQATEGEVPIERLPKFLRQSEREFRSGKPRRTFDNVPALMNWLDS